MVYNVNYMSGWCFAIVNGKLAEIFFDKKRDKPKILGHAFVEPEEYKTKKELKWIKEDTAKYQLSYKNKKYKDLMGKEKLT